MDQFINHSRTYRTYRALTVSFIFVCVVTSMFGVASLIAENNALKQQRKVLDERIQTTEQKYKDAVTTITEITRGCDNRIAYITKYALPNTTENTEPIPRSHSSKPIGPRHRANAEKYHDYVKPIQIQPPER